MKQTILLIAVIIAGCLPVFAQTTTKFGDVVSTLDGIMKAYYDVVSVKQGEKVSYERDSCLHIKNAGVGLIGLDKNGKPFLRYITLKEYHRLSDPQLEKEGFYEKEISRKVEHFGNMYHVFSTYESRNVEGGPVTDRGINSIELYFDGTRFWITSWSFDSERKDNPIPTEYLDK